MKMKYRDPLCNWLRKKKKKRKQRIERMNEWRATIRAQ